MNVSISVPDRLTSASFCDEHRFKVLDFSPRSLDSLFKEYAEYRKFVDVITETISTIAKHPLPESIHLMAQNFTKSLGIRWLELRQSANTCPHCHLPAKKNGSVNGKQKFTCYHSESHDDGKIHSFNPDTSFEAQVFWYLSTVMSLAYIALGMTEKNIAKALTIPRFIVEESVKTGARTLKLEKFKVKDMDAVLYIDESGAFFKGVIIAARINGKIHVRLAAVPVNLDLKLFFKELKEIVESKNVVVVTDGKPDYVALVRNTWPNAVHVAQFHEKDVLGQVHVYFMYDGVEHTLRTPWDIFIRTEIKNSILLPAEVDEIPHGKSTRIGKYRLEKVQLFDSRVLYPYRPKPGRNPKKKKKNEEEGTSERVVEKEEVEVSEVLLPKERKQRIKSGTERRRARCIAEVDVKKWREHPIVAYGLRRIEPIFSGKHITSNPVENVFSILKPLMYIHRTERNIMDLARVILFFFSLRSLTWYQLLIRIVQSMPLSVFLEEIKKRRACTRKREKVEVIRNGIYDIVYVKVEGRKKTVTKRRIVVQSIRRVGRKTYIYAFCMLRNAHRKFLASNIIRIKRVG